MLRPVPGQTEYAHPTSRLLDPVDVRDGEPRFVASRPVPEPGRPEAAGYGLAGAELRLLRAVAGALAETENVHAAFELLLRGVCEASGWAVGQAWLVHS